MLTRLRYSVPKVWNRGKIALVDGSCPSAVRQPHIPLVHSRSAYLHWPDPREDSALTCVFVDDCRNCRFSGEDTRTAPAVAPPPLPLRPGGSFRRPPARYVRMTPSTSSARLHPSSLPA